MLGQKPYRDTQLSDRSSKGTCWCRCRRSWCGFRRNTWSLPGRRGRSHRWPVARNSWISVRPEPNRRWSRSLYMGWAWKGREAEGSCSRLPPRLGWLQPRSWWDGTSCTPSNLSLPLSHSQSCHFSLNHVCGTGHLQRMNQTAFRARTSSTLRCCLTPSPRHTALHFSMADWTLLSRLSGEKLSHCSFCRNESSSHASSVQIATFYNINIKINI